MNITYKNGDNVTNTTQYSLELRLTCNKSMVDGAHNLTFTEKLAVVGNKYIVSA